MKNHTTFKVLALTALITVSSPIQAGPFKRILDNVMATINPKANIIGPVFNHETKNKDGYGDELATIIMEESHKQAKRFLAEGNHQAYYAFMVLAFTVPNQEGLYVHFREVPASNENCNDDRTEGKDIHNRNAKKNFQKYLNNRGFFRDRDDGFLLPCSRIEDASTYRQLIVGGSDGSDVGIMQLSVLWHAQEFLEERRYTSVRSTIQYGLSYLMRQYKKALRIHTQYINEKTNEHCFTNSKSHIDFDGLIRGSWSAYNGGPSKICRFVNPDDPHASHDKGFKNNLQATLNINDGGIFGFNKEGELPLGPKVRKALEEAISNYENKTNNRVALREVLGE